jgi:hypothetical protein
MSEKGPLSPIAINAIAIMFVLIGLPFAVSLIANSNAAPDDYIEMPADASSSNTRHDRYLTMNQTGINSDNTNDTWCGGFGYSTADYYHTYENCPTVEGTTMYNLNGDRYQTMETCDPTTYSIGSGRSSCGDGPYTFILATGPIKEQLIDRTITEISIDMLALDVFQGTSYQCDDPTIFNEVVGSMNVWFNTGQVYWSTPNPNVTPITPVPYSFTSNETIEVFNGEFSSVNSIVVDSVSNTSSRSVDYLCQYAFTITIPITAMNAFLIDEMAEQNDEYNQSWFVITLDNLAVPDLSQGLTQSGLYVPFFPQNNNMPSKYLVHVEFGVVGEASGSLSVQAGTLILSIGLFGVALASTEAWDPFMERVRSV